MAVVISKSGSTIEPMSNYMVLKAAMNDAGITLETVAVTDPHDGGDKETLLHGLAKKSGWPIFYVPDGIGGRFSVFSEVGLIVGALTGFSIRQFLDGARDMDHACQNPDIWKNPALLNSVLKFLAGKKSWPQPGSPHALCRQLEILVGMVYSALGRIPRQAPR